MCIRDRIEPVANKISIIANANEIQPLTTPGFILTPENVKPVRNNLGVNKDASPFIWLLYLAFIWPVGGARRKPAPIPIAMLSDVLVICYTFRRMQANCELRLTAWRGTLLATKKPKKFAD